MTKIDLENLKCLANAKNNEENLLKINGIFIASKSEKTALSMKDLFDHSDDKYVNILFRVNINKNSLKTSSDNVAISSVLLLDESQDKDKSNQFWFFNPEMIVQKYLKIDEDTHVFEMQQVPWDMGKKLH